MRNHGAFSVIETVVSFVILGILLVAVSNGVVTMLNASYFGDNEFNATSDNRILQTNVMNSLKQAKLSSITLSGSPQAKTIEVSKAPAAAASVDIYPAVEFEQPVGFVYESDRTVWSNDADAKTLASSSNPIYDFLPCRVRLSRDSVTGIAIVEYVRGGNIIGTEMWRHCDELSEVTDDGGSELPGLGFYLYPATPVRQSVGALISTSYGSKTDPADPWFGVSSEVKIIPKN